MTEAFWTVVIGAAVDNPRLHALFHYWDAKRASRPMPSYRQIDPIEIPWLLPIILIADTTSAGTRIRLMGTDATAACGQEMRGKLVHEFEMGDYTPLWLTAFAVVRRSCNPASAGGAFRRGDERLKGEAVLLPLSDDGVSVSHVLGGLLVTKTWRSDLSDGGPAS